MADIKNPRLLYAKGALFVLGGTMAAGLILAEHPTIKVALLLAIAIWCFARAYYFAFYVSSTTPIRATSSRDCGRSPATCFGNVAEREGRGQPRRFPWVGRNKRLPVFGSQPAQKRTELHNRRRSADRCNRRRESR